MLMTATCRENWPSVCRLATSSTCAVPGPDFSVISPWSADYTSVDSKGIPLLVFCGVLEEADGQSQIERTTDLVVLVKALQTQGTASYNDTA